MLCSALSWRRQLVSNQLNANAALLQESLNANSDSNPLNANNTTSNTSNVNANTNASTNANLNKKRRFDSHETDSDDNQMKKERIADSSSESLYIPFNSNYDEDDHDFQLPTARRRMANQRINNSVNPLFPRTKSNTNNNMVTGDNNSLNVGLLNSIINNNNKANSHNSNNSNTNSNSNGNGINTNSNQPTSHLSNIKLLNDQIPTIYYCSRTHKQITQMVRELRRTGYRDIEMSILSSREKTCIHPKISKSSSKNEDW